MPSIDETDFYESFFQDKVVFLTGATGNLGSCILYKLVTQLNVRHVYVLVRGSKDKAIRTWTNKMPMQIEPMLKSGKISFMIGDIALPTLGLQEEALDTLRQNANIVIHTAASISLMASIKKCVQRNCDPLLELAGLASGFSKLERFVHVSTAYANSFMPDGTVNEQIYALDGVDPEVERESILRTGSSEHTRKFAFPYAFSKHLAEQLLMNRFPELPTLIVRPSIIGPSAKQPFPMFGTAESLPITQFLRLYIRDDDSSRIWHSPKNSTTGTNILDEVPVDWVSNILLLHVAAESTGIVHASSGTYVQQTFDDHYQNIVKGTSPEVGAQMPPCIWTTDTSVPQCALASFYGVGHRDWHFGCERSASFRHVGGPLSVHATVDTRDEYNIERFTMLVKEKWIEEGRNEHPALAVVPNV